MLDSLTTVAPVALEFLLLLVATIIVALIKPIRYNILKFFVMSLGKTHGFKVLSLGDAMSHNEVYNNVVGIRHVLGADRVAVFQFENGNRFSLSNPTWKITQTYQAIADGRAFITDTLKQEPVSNLLEMIIPLFDMSKDYPGFNKIRINSHSVKRMAVLVHSDELPNCRYRYELLKHGIKYDYLFPLKNSEDKMFGICSVGYSYRKELTDSSLIEAGKVVEKIQTYLNSAFLDSIKKG